MKITEMKVAIRDLVTGYLDSGDEGVVAYGGKLDVRPAYQREFVYEIEDSEAVINSIQNNYPLNVLYWVDREDGTYEVLDGQQRIISICQFHNADYSIKDNTIIFDNLPADKQKQFLDYELIVYVCKGEESEKIAWFKIVNIAGKSLNDQELRNSIYHGAWLEDAKRKFSKTNGHAADIGSDYINGSAKRQDYLETAIEWIAGKGDDNIRKYMSKNHKKKHATPLWNHFETVINWTKNTFPEYRKEMKGIDWGRLYKAHKNDDLNPKELELRIKNLMKDENDELKTKRGIWEYVLTGDKRLLDIRAFNNTERRKLYERQEKKCLECKNQFKIEEMDADHIEPWKEGGATRMKNARMLCKKCNRGRRD